MNFDFTKTVPEKFANFKGGEGCLIASMFSDGMNRILYATLPSGSSIGSHTHQTNSEILLILEGEGYTVLDGETSRLSAGMCTYCPKGSTHMLVNDSDKDLRFFAVVPEQ